VVAARQIELIGVPQPMSTEANGRAEGRVQDPV